MITETILPFSDDIPLAEVFRNYYTNDVARVLAVEGHPHQEHPPLGGQESILYLLLASRPESLGEQKYALVVNYRLFVNLSGQRELMFKDCLEEDGPFVHACPLSVLGQLSPTPNPVTLAWRLACWNYWFDQACPIQHEVPTSLPVALLSSPVHLVVSFHRGQLFQLTWVQQKPPRYGGSELLTLHIQSILRARGVQGLKTHQCEGLPDVIRVLTRHEVPLDQGWIPLHSVTLLA